MNLHFTNNEKKLLLEVLEDKKNEIILLYKTLNSNNCLNVKGKKLQTLINTDVKIINNIENKVQSAKCK